MNKKKIFAFLCLALTAVLLLACGLFIYAEGEQRESKYSIVFVHEDKEYPMDTDEKSESIHTYKSDELAAKTLYRIEIKNIDTTRTVASALFYKNFAGEVEVKYDETALTIQAGDGDRIDTQFDFKTNAYYVSVKGGIIANEVPDKFKGCELSAFYFKKTEKVKIEAIHNAEQGVAEWKNNINQDYGKQSSIIVEATGNVYDIELEAVIDYLPIDKLLFSSNSNIVSIVLKKDYELTEAIKLREDKEYTVDLNGFSIKSKGGVFEIDGAALTLEGEGKLESTADVNGAICLKNGSLTLNEQTVLGNNGAVNVMGGSLTVNGGSYDSKNFGALLFSANTDATAVIHDGSFNEALNTNTALSVQGGSITINGGAFFGGKIINTYGEKRDIRILTGLFVSAGFESDVKEYIDEGSTFQGSSEEGYTVIFKEKKYTLTINDGTLLNGYSRWEFEAGESVTVKPDADTSSLIFKRWEILNGDIVIEDLTAKTVTFIMPEGEVVLRAVFEPASAIDTGIIDTDTLPPDDSGEGFSSTVVGGVDPTGTTLVVDIDKSANGSMAIIVIIIILIALLIAAIAVSVILIVRSYKAEREALERAELGDSVVDSLADRLSELDFTSAAGAAGTAEAVAQTNKRARMQNSGGIDFDKEMELGLTKTVGLDALSNEQDTDKDDEIKLRRPKKPVQRPTSSNNGDKAE